ncbi:sensor histidine kinase [Actinomadura hibisca]|uniref:sensor histidine kinase n=1 Tax=Actinomadura hibisca TaxID=68565 RepID=UPI00082B6043|nr:histidine kinase [Actinomadura hibisca]
MNLPAAPPTPADQAGPQSRPRAWSRARAWPASWSASWPAPGLPGGSEPSWPVLRDRLRRPSRRAWLADVLLWAVLAFPVAFGSMAPVRVDSALWWAQAVGLGLTAAAVLVSRAFPILALVLVVAPLPVHGNFVFALPVLAYLAGWRSRHVRPMARALMLIVAGGVALNLVRGVPVTVWFPSTVWLVLLGVFPWLVGRYWNQYQELRLAGWQRAEQLEREQRITAERERLRERARIAHDMHDSLGHELALIAVRAGALQVAPGLAEAHRAAAAELRAGAAQATERLREIIGVLREEPGPASGPAPGNGGAEPGAGPVAAPTRPVGESIAELVDRARASGIRVRLIDATASGRAEGLAADGPEPATAMAAMAAHRVVQEAITNAAKHAPGAMVLVRLSPLPEGGMRVTVVNGPAAGPSSPAGGGLGLTGLAERVRVAGGTLRTGPRDDGGFEVIADLPAAPPAPGPHSAPPLPGAEDPPPTGRERNGTATAPTAAGSESAQRLADERRRLRQHLITAITVPTALLIALGAVMAGYYVYVTVNSVLEPADYAALRPGQDRARVERVLPAKELISADAAAFRTAVPPAAPGADCRFYRSDANPLGLGVVYRVCFLHDRLTGKDAFRQAGARWRHVP